MIDHDFDRLDDEAAELVTVLDVGTGTVRALIAEVQASRDASPRRDVRVLGVGQTSSPFALDAFGFQPEALARSINTAVGQAEVMAKTTARRVWVALPCVKMKSQLVTRSVSLPAGRVREEDLRKLQGQLGQAGPPKEGYTPVHALPRRYDVDGVRVVTAPVGQSGRRLSAEWQFLYAPQALIKGVLDALAARRGVEVVGMMLSVLAVGRSLDAQRNPKESVLVVDIGENVTTVGLWAQGLVMGEAFAFGGRQLTQEVVKTFGCSEQEATRLKHLAGVKGPGADAASIRGDEQENHRIARFVVLGPRIGEFFAHLRAHMERRGLEVGRLRVELMGGTASIEGIADEARRVLGASNCRVVTPDTRRLGGVVDALCDPGSASLVGLLHWRVVNPDGAVWFDPSSRQPIRRISRTVMALVDRLF